MVSAGDIGWESSSAVSYRFQQDTVIAGKNYRRLIGIEKIAIREDTIQRKLYFRFIGNSFNVAATDTGERLFFDYNFIVGDTLSMSYRDIQVKHAVRSIDSVLMDGRYFRRWHMEAQNQGGIFIRYTNYAFIETLGTLDCPTFPVLPISYFENCRQLRCFTSGKRLTVIPDSMQLRCSIRVRFGPATTNYFKNTGSCLFAPEPLRAPSTHAGHAFDIFPNPAARGKFTISLQAEYAVKELLVRVTDALGRRIFQRTYNAAGQNFRSEIVLNNTVPGIYYLEANADGERLIRRFSVE